VRFGIHAAARPVGLWAHGTGFVEARAGAVAVHAAGAAVDDALHPPLAGEGRQQVGGARVDDALRGRRREMQHGLSQSGKPRERRGLVQIAQQRHRASGAQGIHALGLRGQCQHAPARRQQREHAQTHVTAADDEQARASERRGPDAGHKGGRTQRPGQQRRR